MLAIIGGVLAFILGWLTCAIVSIGSKSDLEQEIMFLREERKNNPFCEACEEEYCAVDLDGTCAFIRNNNKQNT